MTSPPLPIFFITAQHAKLILSNLIIPTEGGDAVNALAEQLQEFVESQRDLAVPPSNPVNAARPVPIVDINASAPLASSESLGTTMTASLAPSSSRGPTSSPRSSHPKRATIRRNTYATGAVPSKGKNSTEAGASSKAAARIRGGQRKRCCRNGVAAPAPSRGMRRRGAHNLMGPEHGVIGELGDQPGEDSDDSNSVGSGPTEIVDESMDVDGVVGHPHYTVNGGLPVTETVNLCDFSQELIYGMRSAAQDCVHGVGYSKMAANMHHMMRLMVFGGLTAPPVEKVDEVDTSPGGDQTLLGLASFLHRADNMEALVQLRQVCYCMEFAAHVQVRLRDKAFKTRFELFGSMVEQGDLYYLGVTAGQLNRYYNLGAKASILAEAGTIYIVMFLVISRSRSLLLSLPGDMVAELARVIRWPDDSSIGKIVKQDLVPAVLYLRTRYPVGLNLLFTPQFLDLVGGAGEFDAVNLLESDRVFKYYKYDLIDKPRCEVTWAPILCLPNPPAVWNRTTVEALQDYAKARMLTACDLQHTGCPESIPPSLGSVFQRPKTRWDKTVENVTVMVINTNFCLKELERIPLRKLTRSQREKLTVLHRQWALEAAKNIPNNFTKLERKIKSQLHKGKKARQSMYTYIDTAHFPNQIIKINDVNKGLVVLVIPTMPQKLREETYAAIRDVHNTLSKYLSPDQLEKLYECIHYSVWNRYSKRGTGAPTEAHPSSIRREGKAGPQTTRVNIPRELEEAKLWQTHKERLRNACAPFFAWVEDTLKDLLPEEFSALEVSINVLPVGDSVLCHPFTSVVVNFNVNTIMHVDDKDKEICVVFQLSDCTGGELCLAEPGLVLRLRNGDGVIFKSNEVTHFNLDYVGERMSIVFHSDSDLDAWVEDYNGWGSNRFFRASQS
ncbi:hypothetical protein FA13DRAFT_1789461 [Coprinellus micaceus]|uniref:Uncharacterized protein n=1 Tax=Coprinellus micaceus TaxID=71717 RepID=A0A4Y7TLC6_COPMI|nr:hypothetical protein FA13DRAFT_1789461 [Coprinellus micaceus]